MGPFISFGTTRALAPGKFGYLALIHAARRWKWDVLGSIRKLLLPSISLSVLPYVSVRHDQSSGTEFGGFTISLLHP